MSSFVQDNQAVIKTADEKIILLIKGGDSNLCSGQTNRRVTSWYIQGVFPNESEYMAFVEVILFSDVNGGSWKFNSLRNKTFEGFREYENTIINRFEKAFKSALITDWKISDVTTQNVAMFKSDMENLLKKNNYSLNDEDGYSVGIRYFLVSYDKEVTPEQRALESLKEKYYSKQSDFQNGKYIEFCKKYSDGKIEELINDVHFCAAFAKFNISWSGPVSMLLKSVLSEQTTNEMDFACFNIIANQYEHNVKLILSLYDCDIEVLMSKYPRQMETLTKLDSFKNRCLVHIETEKQKESDYSLNRFTNNYELMFNADYKKYKEQIDIKINEKLGNAKDEFIKNWNDLIASCWYKTTNERLPRIANNIDIAFKTNTFTIESIKEDCEENFKEVLVHNERQYEKNQKAIKKVFQDLVSKYTVLFSENSIELLCEHLSLSKPIKETVIKETVKIEVVQKPKKKYEQLSLFDFAA